MSSGPFLCFNATFHPTVLFQSAYKSRARHALNGLARYMYRTRSDSPLKICYPLPTSHLRLTVSARPAGTCLSSISSATLPLFSEPASVRDVSTAPILQLHPAAGIAPHFVLQQAIRRFYLPLPLFILVFPLSGACGDLFPNIDSNILLGAGVGALVSVLWWSVDHQGLCRPALSLVILVLPWPNLTLFDFKCCPCMSSP